MLKCFRHGQSGGRGQGAVPAAAGWGRHPGHCRALGLEVAELIVGAAAALGVKGVLVRGPNWAVPNKRVCRPAMLFFLLGNVGRQRGGPHK